MEEFFVKWIKPLPWYARFIYFNLIFQNEMKDSLLQ